MINIQSAHHTPELKTSSSLMAQVEARRAVANARLDNSRRALLGQFFTPAPIAQFMGSMFEPRSSTACIRLLDAGAGIGSLTAATVAQICQRIEFPAAIQVTAFEIEPVLIEYLQATLNDCGELCKEKSIEFEWSVAPDDFVLTGKNWLIDEGTFFAGQPPRFDYAILNPPYRKINSDSDTRRLLRQVGIETSNLYAAFAWLAAKLLKPGGEMVAITPRSFCNGPYFRPFRLAWLEMMAMRQVHVFESRDSAFRDDAVLQENIIVHGRKEIKQSKQVTVSQSFDAELAELRVRQVDFDEIVHPDDPDAVIHIVPDEFGEEVRQGLENLKTKLASLGLSASTGRVVEFRARSLLRMEPEADSLPLIHPGHFSDGYVSWPRPGYRKPNALAAELEAEQLLVPSGFYVLVKRLTAKEETRRVVAAIFDPRRTPGPRVGFENHLNYYHRSGGGLPENLAKGLAAYLNSTLIDDYFRQFNGHTQVNAADLRRLPYPNEAQLIALGKRIGGVFPVQEQLDQLVMEELEIMPAGRKVIDPKQVASQVAEMMAALEALTTPREQLNERSALTMLALLGLRPGMPWADATNPLLGITEIMDYLRAIYGKRYKPNTRETIRRQTVHQFVQMGLVVQNPDDPSRPINSPHNRYQVDDSTLELFKALGSPAWEAELPQYLAAAGPSQLLRVREREMTRIKVRLPDGREKTLSAGGQNTLIRLILEEFCERFTPGGYVAYLGDAEEKLNEADRAYLAGLGVDIDEHGKMPDVIVHWQTRNWLVIIEAVTSYGPISLKRHNELKALFKTSTAGLVFVTAFENRRAMAQYLPQIAWETEVWAADSPSHLIHFNGERFLGPHDPNPSK
jgi:adenine-specific DNA-methyltransferase